MQDISWDLENLDAVPAWRGSIDRFAEGQIADWAIALENPARPVVLDICVLGEKVMSVVCAGFRQDVPARLQLPVKAGFVTDLAKMPPPAARAVLARLRDSDAAQFPVSDCLEIRIAGQDLRLPVSHGLNDAMIDRKALIALLEPLVRQFEHGDSTRIQERDRLLDAPVETGTWPARVIAYYLPQFHPFGQNDEWWGDGFTEWTNVTVARPMFPDHYQPHLPADLGYYDLRVADVQRRQVDLARRYGISGFCYYYYWFSGQTLMTLPIDRHVSEDYDVDFCLCWANETWSRRWDGSEADVLIGQRHDFDSDVAFIHSCLPYFRSDRYIKIDGAPFLQVYRISLMENPAATIARWREIVKAEGFPDLHVCMVETFGLTDPGLHGCDSSSQFPPHDVIGREISDEITGADPAYAGQVYDYADVLRKEMARSDPPYLRFRGAMPSWDNTSRKGLSGNVFQGASPALFETWMKFLVNDARRRLPADRRLIFVNAWNEWAEGAHLEPDRRHGHGNLRAVRNALGSESLALLPLLPGATDSDEALDETRRYVDSLIRTNAELTRLIRRDRHDLRYGEEAEFLRIPPGLLKCRSVVNGTFGIDTVNGRMVNPQRPVMVGPSRHLDLRGWIVMQGQRVGGLMLGLRNSDGPDDDRHVAAVWLSENRDDVVRSLSLTDQALGCGFGASTLLNGVPPGAYDLELICPDPDDARAGMAVQTYVRVWVG